MIFNYILRMTVNIKAVSTEMKAIVKISFMLIEVIPQPVRERVMVIMQLRIIAVATALLGLPNQNVF